MKLCDDLLAAYNQRDDVYFAAALERAKDYEAYERLCHRLLERKQEAKTLLIRLIFAVEETHNPVVGERIGQAIMAAKVWLEQQTTTPT